MFFYNLCNSRKSERSANSILQIFLHFIMFCHNQLRPQHMQGACLFSISYPCSVSSCFTLPAIRCQKKFFSLIYDVLYKNKLFPIDFYTKINHNYITIVRKGVYFFMETCQNLIINSDASENVAYNHPDFPAL